MASLVGVDDADKTIAALSIHDPTEAGAEQAGDPYRSHLLGSDEEQTQWRHGGPPTYHVVNRLFQNTRSKEWPKGSLEEVVQNLVKSWEMELSHKTRKRDFKTIHHDKFCFSVNGGAAMTAEEALQVGSYNALLKTVMPDEHGDAYRASQETFDSSHDIFRAVFPGGFAWEVLEVYSGPPTVAFKWRHWGKMEGPFKGHAPTHKFVESIGTCIAKVDESLRIMDLDVYYDPTQFLGQLMSGPKSPSYVYQKGIEGCPFAASPQDA